MAPIISQSFDVMLSFGRQFKRFSVGVFPSLIANLQGLMQADSALHLRRRALTPAELDAIPWIHLLSNLERERATEELKIADADAGEYICRIGRPVTYWFGVVDGLLKMSSDNAEGQTMTFTGVPPGGWFGEGTAMKRETYRYNCLLYTSDAADE